ncbi:MAG TPA: hypothetical protein VGN12_28975 [Pirellulales bacterium]|jgi:hypothetical protein
MRRVILGALAGAALVYAAVAGGNESGRAWAQRATVSPEVSTGLITHPVQMADGRQMLTIVDPRTQVLGYYQLDPVKGEIVLKGIRNIHWDLQIEEYNGVSPLPSEVRSLVDQR